MILFILFTLLVVFLFHELYWKRRGLPPGPIPLPFLGNLLAINKKRPGYEAFTGWTKKYGDVYTFWMGQDPYVMINSYEKMKETFVKDGDAYSDKKFVKLTERFRGGQYGVIDSNGERWREHRRFALQQLRDFGVGKDLMQSKILLEVEEFFKAFDPSLGTEVDLPSHIDMAIGNIINQVLFGYRFEGDSVADFKKLKKIIDGLNDSLADFWMMIQFLAPWTANFVPGTTLETLFIEMGKKMFDFFGKQIDMHKKEIDFEEEENKDFVEAYLKEQKKRQSEGDVDSFCNKQLINICLDLWFAGLSTTTNTLTWIFAFCINYPEVQDRIQEELDRVIGSDRLVTTSDKNDLVYLNAFINESQRCVNLIPMNLQHVTTREVTINGYKLKKGTGVIAQIGTLMCDEKLFPNPEQFRPERFIENGKLKKCDELMPFSVGKRQCLGEGLARMELFLFTANSFNRYRIKPSSNGLPSLDKSKDSNVQPRFYNAILERRHK